MLMTSEKYNTESEVLAIREPAFTKSWHPMSHGKVIEAAHNALHLEGIEIKKKEYSLSKNGLNMFGIWQLDYMSDEKKTLSIGIRNSMQKHFAVGICAGNNIMVCDNMSFDGEFIDFRKHTSGLTMEELFDLMIRAMLAMRSKMATFNTWFDNLAMVNLPEDQFKIITFLAMERGILSPSKFHEFLGHYEDEIKENDSQGSLLDFHGANTRSMRNTNLFTTQKKNAKLQPLCNEYIEMVNTMGTYGMVDHEAIQ